MKTDHTPDLDALERLLEECGPDVLPVELPSCPSKFHHLQVAAVNALPALIAAAWEREALERRAERAEQREARLRAALRELTSTVRGECPALLNEDSGGDGALAVEIDDLLSDAALAEGQDG